MHSSVPFGSHWWRSKMRDYDKVTSMTRSARTVWIAALIDRNWRFLAIGTEVAKSEPGEMEPPEEPCPQPPRHWYRTWGPKSRLYSLCTFLLRRRVPSADSYDSPPTYPSAHQNDNADITLCTTVPNHVQSNIIRRHGDAQSDGKRYRDTSLRNASPSIPSRAWGYSCPSIWMQFPDQTD